MVYNVYSGYDDNAHPIVGIDAVIVCYIVTKGSENDRNPERSSFLSRPFASCVNCRTIIVLILLSIVKTIFFSIFFHISIEHTLVRSGMNGVLRLRQMWF